MGGSIRRRLLAGIALAVALTFAVAGAVVTWLLRASLAEEFDAALVARARAIASNIEDDDGKIELEVGADGAPGDATRFQVWQEGRVLLRSTTLRGRDLVPAGPLERDVPLVSDAVLPDGRQARQVTLHYSPRRELGQERDPRRQELVVLAVARDLGEIDGTMARVTRSLVVVGLLATLLSAVIAFGVVRFGLAPVRALAAAIAEVREGELLARLDKAATPRELSPVVERLDDLLRRLAAAFARERELTAEVAHELRTPLAGLRATLEVALGRDDRPSEKYRAALAECLSITRQTEALVQTMLSLAQLDAGVVKVRAEPVALHTLVAEVVAELAPRAAARGVTVHSVLPATEVATDAEKLRVVVHNLVENAVSYVDERGAIFVELHGATLQVRNTGCLLAPADVPRVFERFWRGDAARSSGAHAGLGLALCQKLMTTLGGSLTAQVSGDTFVATVKL